MSLKGDKKALADDDTLLKAGVVDGEELNVKDLGPQISWRTVFLVEYVSLYVVIARSSLIDYLFLVGWTSRHTSHFLFLPETDIWG